MLILRPYEPKLLMPIPQWQWREPSAAQPIDTLGGRNHTIFWVETWQIDGGLVDRQTTYDRDEFDALLWRLPRMPGLRHIWAASTVLSATPGSLLTYEVPADWNSADNKIECIGGGGDGSTSRGSGTGVTGGAGGSYGYFDNLTLTPGGTADYRIGGAAQSTWFNGADYASAPTGAPGGNSGGSVGASTARAGAAGGGNGKGTGGFNGGRSGNIASSNGLRATGGGGAAGPEGDGSQGVDGAGNTATAGGNAAGGALGSAGVESSASAAGGNGTNLQGGTVGSGGGSGGANGSYNGAINGAGGNYGGGCGGLTRGTTGGSNTAPGKQGVIVVTYTPMVASSGEFFAVF